MSYTDPSGYFFKWIADVWENTVGDVLRAIADIPILDTLVKFGLNLVCPGICTIAYSVASAYAVTGSLTAAVTAGFVAHVFSEIGERFRGLSDTNQQAIANGLAKEVDFVEFGGNTLKTSQMLEQISAHALTGGISAVASGGRFGSAFVSAGLTKGIMGQLSYDDSPQAVAGRTVLASVIGGTASVLTGGKFANGASTAAIAHLLNAEGSKNTNTNDAPEENNEQDKNNKQGNDVEKIQDGFNKKILEMTKNGERHSTPQWNNVSSSLFQVSNGQFCSDYQGCWQQAITMQSYLELSNMDLNFEWNFELRGTENNLFIEHWWLIGTSPNIDGTIFIIDPWKGCFSISNTGSGCGNDVFKSIGIGELDD